MRAKGAFCSVNCVFKSAEVFLGNSFSTVDVIVDNGTVSICDIGAGYSSGTPVFDCAGKYIFPGFADVHVHLREPGFFYKESIATGTMAAARGGFTDVCAMPNLDPVPDSIDHLEVQMDIIRRDACINVHPYGAITIDRKGEKLSDMASMARYAVAFSDDGSGVQNDGMMREAMLEAKRLNKIIAAHCEVNELLRGGYIHDGEYARAHGHKGICSESEWRQIARDIELAAETGCKYHVCHISCAESVELIRQAKKSGVDITCETAPHYLVFCDEDMQEDGRFKMNPPLRSRRDMDALIEGIVDGTIDMIATDHAPHSAEEKSRGLRDSAMGVVGIETSFAACYTKLVREGIIPLTKLVELMHTNPSKRFGIGHELYEGAGADFTVFDLEKSYIVNENEFLSKGRATPFIGKTLYGRCLMTVCGGEIVWEEGKK
ncbi:MAG: dihydroorotase [Clostridiales bacterium]|nr:dihydroorotase [Clostridiales bacterium]